MSDQKQNRLSFGQKRQIVCLLDEGVSHFVDRLDSFCTYLSSIVDSIDNILNTYICLTVVELEYIAASLCSLLSNTVFFRIGVFSLFFRAFRGAKTPDFDCAWVIIYLSTRKTFILVMWEITLETGIIQEPYT